MSKTIHNEHRHAGVRIKKIRKQKGLTQLVFANALGIARGHVSRVETGDATPSCQLIKLICLTFDVDENWLKTGKSTPQVTPETPHEHANVNAVDDCKMSKTNHTLTPVLLSCGDDQMTTPIVKSTCPKCKNELTYIPNEIAPFCERCGEKVYIPILCRSCGNEASNSSIFCRFCGDWVSLSGSDSAA